MLKIRLAQHGSKNRRTYRIIAIEEGKRRNGKPVETLGFYNPLVKPAQISIDKEKLAHWKKLGAVVTNGVTKLLTTTS